MTVRRPWTEAELARLAELYPTTTAAACARELGRTTRAVHHAARTYGLTKGRHTRAGDAFLAALRRRNREGWTDGDIAAELGCERHTVSKHRRRLGLPSHARGDRYRARVRARTREQCAAAGVDNLGELRSLGQRVAALRAGWPADLRPRHVQILGLLEARGPLTRREIADAIGLPWIGSRRSLKSRDPEGSYLAHLIRRGLVVDLGRLDRVTGRGKGRSTHLYDLSLTARRSES